MKVKFHRSNCKVVQWSLGGTAIPWCGSSHNTIKEMIGTVHETLSGANACQTQVTCAQASAPCINGRAEPVATLGLPKFLLTSEPLKCLEFRELLQIAQIVLINRPEPLKRTTQYTQTHLSSDLHCLKGTQEDSRSSAQLDPSQGHYGANKLAFLHVHGAFHSAQPGYTTTYTSSTA